MQIPLDYKVIVYWFCLLVLWSCSTLQNWDDSLYEDSSFREDRSIIVKNARQQLGAGYRYASRGPSSFDCSGLVAFVYRKSGIPVKGSAERMSDLGQDIGVQNALPGDLIFYIKQNHVFHVSIISKVTRKNLWVVHSTSSRGVIEQDIMASTYWKPKVFKVISLSDLIN